MFSVKFSFQVYLMLAHPRANSVSCLPCRPCHGVHVFVRPWRLPQCVLKWSLISVIKARPCVTWQWVDTTTSAIFLSISKIKAKTVSTWIFIHLLIPPLVSKWLWISEFWRSRETISISGVSHDAASHIIDLILKMQSSEFCCEAFPWWWLLLLKKEVGFLSSALNAASMSKKFGVAQQHMLFYGQVATISIYIHNHLSQKRGSRHHVSCVHHHTIFLHMDSFRFLRILKILNIFWTFCLILDLLGTI